MTWQVKPLSEICDFQRGLTYAKGDEVSESGNIVLRANNIDLDTNQLDLSELRHIRKEIAIPESKKVKQGSLIVCTASGSKSHLGKVALVDRDYGYAFGGFMGQIAPKPGLHPKYLFHLMTSKIYKDFIDGLSDGANINNLKFDDLGRFDVSFPELAEQHRIVAFLDEAFAGIATAKANAEKSLRNARAALDAALSSRLENSAGWPTRTLGDLCEIARGGSPRPIKTFLTDADKGINWIKISDASASSKYIYKTKEKIKPAGASRSRMVHDGDFILSNSMSFGRPYIMRTSGCIHDGWLVLSGYQDSFDQNFLYLLLGSQFVYRQFDRLAAGSTVRNLNIELASRVDVPVPPLDTQTAIAYELGALANEIGHLESLYTRKLAALDELKQSLLHQAFSGQL